jgi:hypothetical protein
MATGVAQYILAANELSRSDPVTVGAVANRTKFDSLPVLFLKAHQGYANMPAHKRRVGKINGLWRQANSLFFNTMTGYSIASREKPAKKRLRSATT